MTSPTLGGWLVHVLRAADGALSLEEALHVILDSMKTYFPCQSVAVILIDEDTKEVRIKISRQISYTFVKKFHRDGPSPTAERVVLEQQPVLLNDVAADSETYRDLKLEHDFSSAVLAPVVKEQRGVGYIFCDRANHERFDETDLLHLQVIGYVIGNLMEKFELIQRSKKLSNIDDASKALQYKAFVSALATELHRAREHEYSVALALFAVPAFRTYIETYGIEEAHALLAEVAAVIKERIRDMDLLARFGADEFVLCLSGLTEDEARAQLQAIRAAVAEKAVGQADAAVELTTGGILLGTAGALMQPLQDIMAALGKSLMEAKSGAADTVVLHTIEH
ncbi:MAG: GGDEF domain-containing protein [Phycisphaerae bacterium]|nr:GGDEF domain-containing protein [Phycisphaerae bacterium]